MVAILGWDSEYILKIKPTGFLDEKAYQVRKKRRVEYNQGFCSKQPEGQRCCHGRSGRLWRSKNSVLNISLRIVI